MALTLHATQILFPMRTEARICFEIAAIGDTSLELEYYETQRRKRGHRDTKEYEQKINEKDKIDRIRNREWTSMVLWLEIEAIQGSADISQSSAVESRADCYETPRRFPDSQV